MCECQTAHAGGEVPSGEPQDERGAGRHVLAAVVPDALHDGHTAAVPHAEPLRRYASVWYKHHPRIEQ